MSDDDHFEGGHIDTPVSNGVPTRRPRQSPPIETPCPEVEAGPGPPHFDTPRPLYWQVRARNNPSFAGREDRMVALHNSFQASAMVHLRGPLGSGTTQTALAYAWRARPHFDAIVWVDGRSRILAQVDLARACAGGDIAWRDEASLKKQVDAIAPWLRSHLRWLMIIDGVESLEVVRALVPNQPDGRVLITGHHSLEDAAIKVVMHPHFSQQSLCLFLAHWSQQERDEHASAVARLFNHATLPVYLAGACCRIFHVPMQRYHDRAKESMARHNPHRSDDDLEHSVLAAVEIDLQYVSEQDPAALELMALCAWFDSSDIALAMLRDGAPFLPKRLSACVSNPLALNATLTLLYRLGLVQFEQNGLAVHPSIQAAVRALLGAEQGFAWLMTALRVVREAFPEESNYFPPVPACSVLLRHVFAVTTWSEQSDRLREGTGLLLSQVGLYVHACRELDTARDCFERAIRAAESLHGPVHPTVAARANSLGVVLQELGDYTAARGCYERAFAICEAVYGPARDAAMGPAHRSMLTMPSRNLCQVLELMGDIPAAKAAYQRAIGVFIEIYCWNHSLVAESMWGLGQLFFKEKDTAAARQYFHKAILAEENADAPERGNLARFSRSMAQCFFEEGAFDQAQSFYERALQLDRRDFGPHHPHVAADLIGLGRTYRAQSDFAKAQARFDDALAVHSATASGATREKALVWRYKGRAHLDNHENEDAVRCLKESLRIAQLVHGRDSPTIGPEYVYLGKALARLERLPEAESALRSAVALHQNQPWMDNDAVAALYTRLARVMREQNKLGAAIDFFQRSLEHDRARLGDHHELVGTIAHILGTVLLAANEYRDALDYFQAALDIYRDTRGSDDPKTKRVIRRIHTLEKTV